MKKVTVTITTTFNALPSAERLRARLALIAAAFHEDACSGKISTVGFTGSFHHTGDFTILIDEAEEIP